MTRIATYFNVSPNPIRKNRVAVFGTRHLSKPIAKAVAVSLTSYFKDKVVYTVVNDLVGKYVRKECKVQKIKTYNRLVRTPYHEYSHAEMSELTVARLAWKVEEFYCVIDSSNTGNQELAYFAIEIGHQLKNFINCKVLDVSQL